jgi:hypothetical protein
MIFPIVLIVNGKNAHIFEWNSLYYVKVKVRNWMEGLGLELPKRV